MAYNEKLADRVRELIFHTHKKVEEKRMFGGLCFMVNGKMCVGVEKERLMVRLDPAKYNEVLEKDGCKPMDFTGKVMKGYVFVDIAALNTKTKTAYWIKLALEYNKIAKASKKEKIIPGVLIKTTLPTKIKIMRKACVVFCSLFIIYSCNSNEEKAKPKFIQKEKAVQSAADMELQAWLKGKVWTAENDLAPMILLKLKSDGNYELKSGKNPSTWEIIDGEIALARLTEWPIEKLDDTTFRLYVKPTDKWYVYKQTSAVE